MKIVEYINESLDPSARFTNFQFMAILFLYIPSFTHFFPHYFEENFKHDIFHL